MKKVLTVTPYRLDNNAQHQHIDYVYQTYMRKLVGLGIVPIICSTTFSEEVVEHLYGEADGLLLIGGADISPDLYNQGAHYKTNVTNPLRDTLESFLIKKAVADKLPLLGICRGMQIVNCVLGGSLCQHLPELGLEEEHFIHEKYYEDSPSYDQVALDRDQYIEVLEETLLADIVGSGKHLVRCAHHQSIESVAESLKINSVTDFGVIEGLEGAGQYLMLVQHHIETQNNEFANSIWKSFADSL